MASGTAPRLAYVAWAAVCIIWGTTYLAILIALETIPPMLLGGIRFLTAGAVLAAVVGTRNRGLPPAREWPRHALVGALMLGVGNGCVVWAERWIPSGIAAVGVAAVPFWMAGAELAFGGARIPRAVLLGLAVGFSGIVVLISPSMVGSATAERSGVSDIGFGVLLVQLACAGWAVGSSIVKRSQSVTNPFAASAVQQLCAGFLLVGVGTGLGEWSELTFTGRTIAAQAYLIVLGSLVAYSAYLYALDHLPITTVSLYAYINPIIAVLLGALVASEPLTMRIAAAAGLVLCGVALVRRGARGVS